MLEIGPLGKYLEDRTYSVIIILYEKISNACVCQYIKHFVVAITVGDVSDNIFYSLKKMICLNNECQ